MTTSNVERTTFDRLGEAIVEARGGCKKSERDVGCQEEAEHQLQMGGFSNTLVQGSRSTDSTHNRPNSPMFFCRQRLRSAISPH